MSASLLLLPAHPQVAVIGVGNRGGAMLARMGSAHTAGGGARAATLWLGAGRGGGRRANLGGVDGRARGLGG